ncbi:MAG: hypothetical protein HYZ51_00965 [Candidatus Doudnabacteria bacterium]|nr:hypothetical protein [Candidatus Doudnabacteria bacterium]
MHLPIAQQNIISLLALEKLSDEKKAAMVEKMIAIIEKSVFARILKQLSEPKKSELLDLLGKKDQKTLEDFMQSSVPNFLELLEEETLKLKEDMVKFNQTLE